ncbi:DcrB family lipoprotein [Erwiniaceae bacterium CAU 1747]
MRNLLKYVSVSLLVVGLAACDGKSDTAAADKNTSSEASQNSQTVSLMDGKLSFALPAGVTDKSGKLGTQANNMHVYADESGQKAIIVIEGDSSNDTLEDLAKRMLDQQRSRAPQLQVVTNKEITVDGQKLQQLDTVISVNNQSAWSSLVMGKVDGKLMTLQISLPGDNQQAAQTEAANFLNTLHLK